MNGLTETTNITGLTPRDTFEATREKYSSIQGRLKARMIARAAEFARGGRSYAFVADEQRVVILLATALAALGDRSAVDELGIAY